MKRRILCLILVFTVLCSLNNSSVFADSRNNQISKSCLEIYRSGYDELRIYNVSGNKLQFHAFSIVCMTNTVRLRWLLMERHILQRPPRENFPVNWSLLETMWY